MSLQLHHERGGGHAGARHCEQDARIDVPGALHHEVETRGILDETPEEEAAVGARLEDTPRLQVCHREGLPDLAPDLAIGVVPLPIGQLHHVLEEGLPLVNGLGGHVPALRPIRRAPLDEALFFELAEEVRALRGEPLEGEAKDAALAAVLLQRAGQAGVEVVEAADVIGLEGTLR